MTRDEFFRRIYKAFADTEIEWEENFVGDEDEAEIYVKFKNIKEDDE